MNMIWHNNVFMQNDIPEMIRNLQPTFIRNFPAIIIYHFIIFNFPEETFPVINAYRNIIQSLTRIIIAFKAYAVTMMDIWIVIIHLSVYLPRKG